MTFIPRGDLVHTGSAKATPEPARVLTGTAEIPNSRQVGTLSNRQLLEGNSLAWSHALQPTRSTVEDLHVLW